MLHLKPISVRTALRLSITLAASCLIGAGTAAQPTKPKLLQLTDASASARPLREATRQTLLAVGRVDWVMACSRGPRPKAIQAATPDDRYLAELGAASTGIKPGQVEPWGQACDPGADHSVSAGLHLLSALGALQAQAPQVGKALRIQPATPAEAKQLARGLAVVLGSLGKPDTPDKPDKPSK